MLRPSSPILSHDAHKVASPTLPDLRAILSESGIDIHSDRIRDVLDKAAAMSDDTLVNTLAHAAKDSASAFGVLARVRRQHPRRSHTLVCLLWTIMLDVGVKSLM